jgi:hypothetical protein
MMAFVQKAIAVQVSPMDLAKYHSLSYENYCLTFPTSGRIILIPEPGLRYPAILAVALTTDGVLGG